MSHTHTQPPTETIDVVFPIRGDAIPLDHGYTLYAALSRLPATGPWLQRTDEAAIQPVRGRRDGDGLLDLTAKSRLGLRLPAASLPLVLLLAETDLDLDGHDLHIGAPRPSLLRPTATLYARMVAAARGDDEERFDADVRGQLRDLEIQGSPTRGTRRTLRSRDQTITGFSLLVTDLSREDSIHLQEAGLGDHRKLGCGVFVPWPRARG
jgi:CRISPR-associated protein Cas6